MAYSSAEHIGSELVHAVIAECGVRSAEGEEGKGSVLAFRGSAEGADWVTNRRFLRARLGNGIEVHRGFFEAIVSASEALMEMRRWIRKPLLITGHSLGGALAILAARMFEGAGFPVLGVYTFGGPRVGNARFAQAYDALGAGPTAGASGSAEQLGLGLRTWRLVNEEDIVPRVPSWFMGYRHVGQEVFKPSLGGWQFNPPVWKKAISDLWGTVKDWRAGRVAQLADHSIERYWRSCQGNLGQGKGNR